MAFFSQKNAAAPKNESRRTANEDEGEKNETAAGYGTNLIAAGALVYIVCFTCLLTFSYQAGKFIEYRIPLFLMQTQVSALLINSSVLTLAVLSAFVLQLSLGIAHAVTPLGRSRRISYFFSVLATLAVGIYLGTLFIHTLRGGRFFFESIYILILYIAVFIPHVRAGKSPLAHSFVSAGFIVILIVTAFYGGIASAKIEDKLTTSVGGETYALAAAQSDKIILSSYDTRRNRFSGRLMILTPEENARLTFIHIPSATGRLQQ